MKWLAAILMILNVVIFLGVSDRKIQKGPDIVTNRPDVNRESMLLLTEVEAATGNDPGERSPTVIGTPGLNATDGAVAGELDAQNLALINSQNDEGTGPRDGAIPPLGADRADVAESTSEADSEQAEAVVAKVEPSIADTPLPVEDGDSIVDVMNQPDVAGMAPDPSLCYRVGPFKDQSLWRRATQWARTLGLAFKPVRSQSRELRAVRVYVGPFESISAAQPEVNVLKQKELDYFVYLHDSNEARISLGYFTQEELATKFVEYLNSQDIAARSQPEYRTLGPFDWMDIDISTTARSRILDRDWGDDDVLVSERDCE